MSTEEKKPNILEMFKREDKFDIGNALLYLENITKHQAEKIAALEEAMMFFSEWYNKTQRVNIELPDHLDENGGTKIIKLDE